MRLTAILLAAVGVAFGLAGPADARNLLFLDNGVVRVGVDLDQGGTITFVSRTGGGDADNVVNDHDLGRLVQQSYYSGPDNLGVPCPGNFAGWNPIRGGDCYGHPSTVLASSDDGHTIYVRSRPLQWAFNGVPCECSFEDWITLDGNAVLVRNSLTNARSDHTLYPAMGQELPAVYTIGRLLNLVTYSGPRPWTNGPLTEVRASLPTPASFLASEHWAASVGTDGFGLGIFQPDVNTFLGGFFGTPGAGGPFDDATGYISPNRPELLDWNIVYQYSYALVLGSVAEIRAYAAAHRPALPDWQFTDNRDGFSELNAVDQGAPIHDETARDA